MNPCPEKNTQPKSATETSAIPVVPPAPDAQTTGYDQNPADSVKPIDKICFQSDDGLLVVRQMVNQIGKYPRSAVLYYALSVALARSGNPNDAVWALDQALRLSKTNPPFSCWCGDSWSRTATG